MIYLYSSLVLHVRVCSEFARLVRVLYNLALHVYLPPFCTHVIYSNLNKYFWYCTLCSTRTGALLYALHVRVLVLRFTRTCDLNLFYTFVYYSDLACTNVYSTLSHHVRVVLYCFALRVRVLFIGSTC